MNTNQLLSIAAIICGVALIIFGISAADSFGSGVSEFFTGAPTDKALWMLIIGVLLAVVGLGSMVYRRKT